ncbi:hypothetical protein MRB53_022140 [Persea americana]|uniref:Uncharacterized protein n=1 Tax=Persea americana TaxID=3435 RepID=A0ACC2L6U5_PERAE|nr:hypothetical protein MRB53_022140 [Persea americana]
MASLEETKVSKKKKKSNGISSRCSRLVKEQRARLYILRRCATMLLCCFDQANMTPKAKSDTMLYRV